MPKSKTPKRKRQTAARPAPPPATAAQQGTVVQHVERREIVESRSGPLPTPEDFAKYDAALPGAAERILKMAEDEQGKRNGFVEKGITYAHATQKRGQWIGMVVVLAA